MLPNPLCHCLLRCSVPPSILTTVGNSVDATEEKEEFGVGRLINHSRLKPNLAVQRVDMQFGPPLLALVAIAAVKPGDEVLYDYGETRPDILAQCTWLENT